MNEDISNSSNIETLFLNSKFLSSFLLIIFGLGSLVLILLYPEIETILLSVGVTLLTSGIIIFIFYPLEKDIVTNVQNEMKNSFDVMKGSFDVINDCQTSDIVRIFENRRDSDDFNRYLAKHFKGENIFMMGTTLKDFFKWGAPYNGLFMDALNSNDTKSIKILLLDPISDAALDAAAIDHGEEYGNEDKYKDSGLYTDLKDVTKFLYELSADHRNKLDIKYTERLPHTFMLKVESFSFIEYYDLGNLKILSEDKILSIHKIAKSMGGYTPIFFVRNSSNFSKLVVSYLEQEMDKKNKQIDLVAQELGLSGVN